MTQSNTRFCYRRMFVLLGLVAILVSLPAWGQENYGTISGTVTDPTGATIPGATVEATSPTLPRGLQATTDALGKYMMPRVPNGTYSITVAKAGFSKYAQREILVKLGQTVTLNVSLNVGAVAEVVEVTAGAGQLDVTSSSSSTSITAATFDNLPRGRQFHTILAVAPGVRMEVKNGNAGVGGFQVDGASGSENAFLIDGVDVADIRRGSLRVQNSVPFEFLSEVQIKSGGFGAEYGGATGGVINATTRPGSNDFHGQLNFQLTNNQLNPRSRGYYQRAAANADLAEFFAPKEDTYRQFFPGFTFGGPILKSTLFFQLGYMPEFGRTERVGVYPIGPRQFVREDITHYGLSRVDFNPTSKLQTYTSWLWAPVRQKGSLPNIDQRINPASNDLSVTGGFQPSQTFNTGANYTLTPSWLVSVRYGYKYQNDKLGNYGLPGAPFITYQNASSRAPNVPAEFAGPNGFSNVSSTFGVVKDITTRHNLYLDTNYVTNIGSTQHIFKFGYARARVGNDVSSDYTNGRFLIYWGDAFSRGSVSNQRGTYGYYTWEDGVRLNSGVNSNNHGFYVQDDIKLASRITLKLGVRLENEFLPPYKPEVNGIKVANPIHFDWADKIAPRIGVAWNPDKGGKWKIAGSFGYYYDVMKYELARGSFGGDYWFTHVYRLDNPNVFALGKANPGAAGARIISYDNRTIPINARGELEGIDPDIKPYTSREFTAMMSKELNSRLVFSARYSRKDLLKAIEDIGVLDAEDNEVYLIGNPGFGETTNTKSVYGQKTPNGKEFLVPKAVRNYDALEFRLDGRYLKNMNVLTSYTWSRLYGNYSGSANADESGRSDPGVSRAFDLPYYYFDASGSQKNALGPLGTDRPHTLKLFLDYSLSSKAGKTIFGLYQIAWSGTPDSTSVIYLSAPTFPKGRGDMGRTPTLTQTDFALMHDWRVGEGKTIRFEANFINLFNQAQVIARTTQLNRASAITDARLPLSAFFSGYDVSRFVFPGSTAPPYNPIYNLPGGNYRAGGAGAYNAPRNVRLGMRFIF